MAMKFASVGALVAAAVLIGAGCADTHAIQRPVQAQQKLAPSASAFVSIPTDGRYGARTYVGSGETTAQIVAAAFARHLTDVRQGGDAAPADAALGLARAAGATYLVAPTILHWEDRATEWSAKPDRAEIRVVVMDAASGNVLDTALIKGRSGIATLGGDHPQDLLPQPVEEYVDALF